MRKNFATPIDADILETFKIACKRQGVKMNEVIEILMQGFTSGKIGFQTKTTYTVEPETEE